MMNFSPVRYMSRPMCAFPSVVSVRTGMGKGGTAGGADQDSANRGSTMACFVESRENEAHAENETGERNQHWKRPFLFRSNRCHVRQPIPAQCRDQKSQQPACCMERTRRSETQQERDHSDSE